MRGLKIKYEQHKKDGTVAAWQYGAQMKIIFDSPIIEAEPKQPLGITYTVKDPIYVKSAGDDDDTFIVSEVPNQTAESKQPLGITYTVKDPIYVKNPGDDDDSFIPEVPNQTAAEPNQPFGITYTVEDPIYVKSTGYNDNLVNEAEGPIPVLTHNLNTSVLQSSTFPSETFFVHNLNVKSTPQKYADELSSPARKKAVNNEGGVRTPRKTPQKTPRRKLGRLDLVSWAPDVTAAFLKECISRKEHVQSDDVPVRIWKDISKVLVNAGHTECGWQECRDKFVSLNIYFEKSWLKVKGIQGHTKWPHYDDFCKIHDLPIDYSEPIEYTDNQEEPGNMLWSEKATKLLISLYEERRHLFKSTKSCIRHTTLYKEIATIMQLSHHNVSHKQCKRHMGTLLQEFHREYDRMKKTGEGPTSFAWYDVLLSMEVGSANLDAPFVFSAGKNTAYSVEGALTPVVQMRGTRTKNRSVESVEAEEDIANPNPPNKSVSKSQPGKKKPLYKNWLQEVQEKKIEVNARLVDEVRLMRVSHEEKTAPRTDAMLMMAEAMKNISAYFNSK